MANELVMLEERLAKPFWDAAAEGRLEFPRCTECRTFNWYPSLHCHKCYSKGREWVQSDGRASLYSWSTVAFPFLPELESELPIIPAVIDIADCGIRMVTRLVDVKPDELVPEMQLEVVFRAEGERKLPLFKPAAP